MDGFKGFGTATALAAVLATAPGCADHVDDKKNPPSALPTDPTATALATARQQDEELTKALAGIFPSDEKPQSTLVSLDPQELQWDFSQWRESQKTPHVAPTSATFGPETVKNRDSSFMLTQNNSWTLYPPKGVRYDIGADEIITVAKKEDHPQKPQKKERPHPDAHNIIENEWAKTGLALHQEAVDQEDDELKLSEHCSETLLRAVYDFGEKAGQYASVSFSSDSRTDHIPEHKQSGTETLRQMTGVTQLEGGNFDSSIRNIFRFGFTGKELTEHEQYVSEVVNNLQNLDNITKQETGGVMVYSDVKRAMIDYLNREIPKIVNPTPDNVRKFIDSAYKLALYTHGDDEYKQENASRAVNAAGVLVRSLVKNESVLEVAVKTGDGREGLLIIPNDEQRRKAAIPLSDGDYQLALDMSLKRLERSGNIASTTPAKTEKVS